MGLYYSTNKTKMWMWSLIIDYDNDLLNLLDKKMCKLTYQSMTDSSAIKDIFSITYPVSILLVFNVFNNNNNKKQQSDLLF